MRFWALLLFLSSIHLRMRRAMRSTLSGRACTSEACSSPTEISCTPQQGMGSMHPSSSGQITAMMDSIGERPVSDAFHSSILRLYMQAGAKTGTFSSLSSSLVFSGLPPRGPPFSLNQVRLTKASIIGLSLRKKNLFMACRLWIPSENTGTVLQSNRFSRRPFRTLWHWSKCIFP